MSAVAPLSRSTSTSAPRAKCSHCASRACPLSHCQNPRRTNAAHASTASTSNPHAGPRVAPAGAGGTLWCMRSVIWVLIALCLAGILVSLGSGLFHLSRGGGEEDSAKLARALTVRISLSLALFVLLFLA